MGLRERWIDIIYKTAKGSRRIKRLLTPFAMGCFLLFFVVLVLVAVQLDARWGLPQLLPRPLHVIVSLPLIAIGLYFMAWSILHFFKIKGTPVPFNPPPQLVTTGPYAFVRNPMLSGVFLLLFGVGFFLRSITLVLIFTPLLILLNVWELKSVEEPELERRLGRAYLDYKERVPMFFPWLKGGTKIRRAAP